MLVNVIYFRGPWSEKFYKMRQTSPFFLDERNSVDAKFMSRSDYVGYVNLEEFDAELLKIAYKVFIKANF
jgi:serine protease inhibitor